MLNFETFLIEKGPIERLGSLIASGKDAERHYKKYFGPEALMKHGNELTLSGNHKPSGYVAGDKVKIDKVAKDVKGRYVAHVGNHQIPMTSFYKPLVGRAGKDQETKEADQINQIHNLIDQHKGNNPYIRMHIGNGKFANVAGVKRVDADIANQYGHKGPKPKADMYLHDEHGTPVSWHSLKAKAGFQQLGGLIDSQDQDGNNHPIVQKMIDHFKKAAAEREKTTGTKEIPEGLQYHHDLDENDPEARRIAFRSMYGKEFGAPHTGLNNVDSIIQGDMHVHPLTRPDPEAKKHAGIPSFELGGDHIHQNAGDNSDHIPLKLVNRKAGITDQQGTGGRLFFFSKDNPAYKYSHDITKSKGIVKDVENHNKGVSDRASARSNATLQRNLIKKQAAAAERAAKKAALPPRVTKTKGKKTLDIWGKHASEPEQTGNDGTIAGSSWHSPADQETVNTIRGQQNA